MLKARFAILSFMLPALLLTVGPAFALQSWNDYMSHITPAVLRMDSSADITMAVVYLTPETVNAIVGQQAEQEGWSETRRKSETTQTMQDLDMGRRVVFLAMLENVSRPLRNINVGQMERRILLEVNGKEVYQLTESAGREGEVLRDSMAIMLFYPRYKEVIGVTERADFISLIASDLDKRTWRFVWGLPIAYPTPPAAIIYPENGLASPTGKASLSRQSTLRKLALKAFAPFRL